MDHPHHPPTPHAGFRSNAMANLGRQPGDQLIYEGQRLHLVHRPVPTRSGATQLREVCIHPGAVAILPVMDNGDLVLIRNRRHTVLEDLLEIPAGTLERDANGIAEDTARAAARELTEETGFRARSLTPFGWLYTSPGILTEKMFLFLARGLDKGPQSLEDNEQIQVQVTPFPEILALIQQNKIVDAKTIATVLKYVVGNLNVMTFQAGT